MIQCATPGGQRWLGGTEADTDFLMSLFYLTSHCLTYFYIDKVSSLNNRIAFHEMPFDGLTNYEIQINFQSAKKRIHELMDKHGLYEFLTETYMDDLFNPEQYKACDYLTKKNVLVLKEMLLIT